MLITGSRALQNRFPNIISNDWDFIGTKKEVEKWFSDKKIIPTIMQYINVDVYIATINNIDYEFELAVEGASAWDYLTIENNKEFSRQYASLETLYSIKKSHVHRINNKKHLDDYTLLKKIVKTDTLKNITDKRIRETNIRLDSLRI